MNVELEKKFDEEFPQTGDKPTHFEMCKCWSCVDYREQIKSFIDKHFVSKKEILDMVGEDAKNDGKPDTTDTFQHYDFGYRVGYNQAKAEIRSKIEKL
ncbi:MAG: hypothetical protein QQN63_05360 [Nitrosopumilus sp.]